MALSPLTLLVVGLQLLGGFVRHSGWGQLWLWG